MAVTRSRIVRDHSDLTHLYTVDDDGGPYRVFLDEWFTRRKRFHCITRQDGEVLFRSRWMGDVLEWLEERKVKRYEVEAQGRRWVVTVKPGAEPKRNKS